MSDGTAYGGDAADTREEIMLATYAALRQHGYAGLSISRIAAETDLSKSSFYHHFDGKDDILLSFADYTIAEFSRGFELESACDPVGDLYAFLNVLIGVEPTEREQRDTVERMGIWLELRSQAIHDGAFREKFTETSNKYIARLTEILDAGVEQGVFEDIDAEGTAIFLQTLVDGIFVEATTRTDDLRPIIWDHLDAYIQNHIVRGELDEKQGYTFGDDHGDGDRPTHLPEGSSPPDWLTGDIDQS